MTAAPEFEVLRSHIGCVTNTQAAIVAAVCCVLFHGYQLFNFPLSIDNELFLGNKEYQYYYIQQGRWGESLRYWLLAPETSIPVTALGFGLLLYSIAFVLILRLLQIRHWETAVVGSPFYFGFPVLATNLVFPHLALELGIGTLAVSMAAIISQRAGAVALCTSALLVGFSISLYQSLIMFAVVLYLAIVTSEILFKRKTVSLEVLSGRYCLVLLLGALYYLVVEYVFLWYFQSSITYIGQFFDPWPLIYDTKLVLRSTIIEIAKLYSGFSEAFLSISLYYRITLVAASVILVIGVMTGRSYQAALTLFGLIALVVTLPFFLHLFNKGQMPHRSLVALPLAAAIVPMFASEITSSSIRRWLQLPLAALLIFEFSAINNRAYYAGYWAFERDKLLGARLINEMEKIDPHAQRYTVALIGMGPVYSDVVVPSVGNSGSTIGASFFAWDGGNSRRVARFMQFLSGAQFDVAPPDVLENALEASESMPSWPTPGSVVQRNGVFLIKLSEPTWQQIHLLCQNRSSAFCRKNRH